MSMRSRSSNTRPMRTYGKHRGMNVSKYNFKLVSQQLDAAKTYVRGQIPFEMGSYDCPSMIRPTGKMLPHSFDANGERGGSLSLKCSYC